MWLRILQHLLPNGRAWQLVINRLLRQFFDGLADLPARLQAYQDAAYNYLRPSATTELERLEDQYALLPRAFTDSQRRDNIARAIKLNDYQSATDVQSRLQAAGFPVFVHPWWYSGPFAGARRFASLSPQWWLNVPDLIATGDFDFDFLFTFRTTGTGTICASSNSNPDFFEVKKNTNQRMTLLLGGSEAPNVGSVINLDQMYHGRVRRVGSTVDFLLKRQCGLHQLLWRASRHSRA